MFICACTTNVKLDNTKLVEIIDSTSLLNYLDINKLYKFLDSLDWENNTWNESHKGAGIYAALVLSGEADLEWQNRYFAWFWENADEASGLWRKGRVKRAKVGKDITVFPHIAASFHYLFNHEYAKMPLRYPEKMIDTCLELYYNKEWSPLGTCVSFADVDWVYCLNRSMRQCSYRFEEGKAALKDFADKYIEFLYSLPHKSHDGFNDLHMLFGAICCVAELQQALPGCIRSSKPLKLVLDRRPFI